MLLFTPAASTVLASRFCHSYWRAGLGGLLTFCLSIGGTQAQVPVLLNRQPTPNTSAASQAASVVLTFSQAIGAASAGNVRVLGNQLRGQRPGTLLGGGTPTLTFDPAQDFAPGELVSVAIPGTVLGSSGSPVARQVYQFRVAAGGTGQASFPASTGVFFSNPNQTMVLGDLDNDGDLDVAVGDPGTPIALRLNAGSGTFTSAPDVPLNTSALALADVDGDGDLDLLAGTSGPTGAVVSVLLNNGAGSFTMAGSTPVAAPARKLALADLDADGDPDLLVVNDNGNVDVRLNNGAGSFAGTGTIYPSQNQAVGLTVGDVDGDGDLDVALACPTGSQAVGYVTISLNNGAGVFANAPQLTAGIDPNQPQLGDLDNDGDLDLVVNNRVGLTVMTYLNNGTGAFGPAAEVAMGGTDLVLADLDADGDLDLATSIGARLNDGRGNFTGRALLPTALASPAPQQVVCGDIDGDLDLDLLVLGISNSTATLRVYRNETGAPPTIAYLAPAAGPVGTTLTIRGRSFTGARAVTLNGAALPGFVVNSPEQLTVSIPAGATSGPVAVSTPAGTATSAGSFTVTLPIAITGVSPARNSPTTAAGAAVAVSFAQAITSASAAGLVVHGTQRRGRRPGTLSGGGTATLSFAPTQGFAPGELVSVSVPASLQGTAGGNVRPQVYQFTGAAPGPGRGVFTGNTGAGNQTNRVIAADVDNDGDLDLVLADLDGPNVRLQLNDGSGNFSAGQSLALPMFTSDLAAADVDGDGDLDLLCTGSSAATSTATVLRNNGGTFASTGSYPMPGNMYRLAVGDLDADGDQDLVLALANGDSVRVRLNDGTGAFAHSYAVFVGRNPQDVALGDVDQDGDLDVLALLPDGGLSVQLNNGAGFFPRLTPGATSGSTVGVPQLRMALGDVDGDGDLDAVVPLNTSIGILLNDGSGRFVPAPPLALGYLHYAVALGDLDADGDLDLTVTEATTGAGNTGAIIVRLNDGNGHFSGTQAVAVGASPRHIILADVDGDGDLDLATPTFSLNAARVDVRWNERVDMPTLTSFSPGSGVVGTPVVLTGTNFTGISSVRFNGTVAPGFVVNSATQITATVPAGATSGPISVSNVAGMATSATSFTVLTLVSVVGRTPARNSGTAPTTATVTVQFSQPITAASAPGLAVFGSLSGGRLPGTRTGGGSATLAFTSTQPLAPGELVSVTLPATLQSGASSVFQPRTYQFQVATGGLGQGNFIAGPTVALPTAPLLTALADVDQDGDLDLLGLSSDGVAGTVRVRMNDGSGSFPTSRDFPLGTLPSDLAVADVDNDGDLDLLVTENSSGSRIYVRLNNGSGSFAGTGLVTLPGNGINGLATGDVDADGDLDLVAVGFDGNAYVRRNDGQGNFSGSAALFVSVGTAGHTSVADVQLRDLDNDDNLDLVLADYSGAQVSIWRNDGSGQFAIFSSVAVANGALLVEARDLDADGDLDVVALQPSANANAPTLITVALNTGNGTFAPATVLSVATPESSLAVGDIDADGDLDLLAFGYYSNIMHVLRNDGRGSFGNVGSQPLSCGVAVLGDLDGDGDLDLAGSGLAAAPAAGVCIAFNGPPPTISSFSPGSAAPGTPIAITGLALSGATAVTFNGRPAAFTVASATRITATVPAGASTGFVVVSTPQGTATSPTPFSVLLATRSESFAGLTLYPQPVHEVLTLAGAAEADIRTVVLRDLLGRALLPTQRLPASQQLSLAGLSPGVYLLELRTGTGAVLVRRISKE